MKGKICLILYITIFLTSLYSLDYEEFKEKNLDEQLYFFVRDEVDISQSRIDYLSKYLVRRYEERLISKVKLLIQKYNYNSEDEVIYLKNLSHLIWRMNNLGFLDKKNQAMFYGLYQAKLIDYLEKEKRIDGVVLSAESMLDDINIENRIDRAIPNTGIEIMLYYENLLGMELINEYTKK